MQARTMVKDIELCKNIDHQSEPLKITLDHSSSLTIQVLYIVIGVALRSPLLSKALCFVLEHNCCQCYLLHYAVYLVYEGTIL